MKYLFLILVVVNLAYFVLQMAGSAPEGATAQALPPPPPSVRPLVTLQQAQGGTSRKTSIEVSRLEQLTTSQPPGAGMSMTCLVLGPFMEAAGLKAVERRLVEIGYRPARRTNNLLEHVGYWIYLPAMDREEAMQVKGRLDEHQDKEYFIGRDHYISLGAFRELSRAEIRMKRVRKLGLDPVLEPRYKSRTVHWLDLEAGIDEAGDLEAITTEFPNVELQHLACE